jgi:hypothetical protein
MKWVGMDSFTLRPLDDGNRIPAILGTDLETMVVKRRVYAPTGNRTLIVQPKANHFMHLHVAS